MKCVRIVGQGVPVRLTNDKARQIMREGDGEYCSKAFWKEWYQGEFYKVRGIKGYGLP